MSQNSKQHSGVKASRKHNSAFEDDSLKSISPSFFWGPIKYSPTYDSLTHSIFPSSFPAQIFYALLTSFTRASA
jgi:hypothetical protein